MFYVLAPLFVMGTTSGMLVIGQAAPIVEDMAGASARAAGAAVTAVALGMVLGKVAWGWVSDRIGRYAVLVLLFAVALAGLLLMSAAGGYALLVLGMATVALCYGGFVAVMGPVTADAFGERYLGVNFGIMFLSIAVAAYAGPQLVRAWPRRTAATSRRPSWSPPPSARLVWSPRRAASWRCVARAPPAPRAVCDGLIRRRSALPKNLLTCRPACVTVRVRLRIRTLIRSLFRSRWLRDARRALPLASRVRALRS